MLRSHTRLKPCYLKVFPKILQPCLLPKHSTKESPVPSCTIPVLFFNLDELRDKCALNWYQGNKLMACSTDLISMGTSQYYTHILLKEKCLISRSQWTTCVYYIKTERWTRFFSHSYQRKEWKSVLQDQENTALHPSLYKLQIPHWADDTEGHRLTFLMLVFKNFIRFSLKSLIPIDQHTDPRGAEVRSINLHSLLYCWDTVLE